MAQTRATSRRNFSNFCSIKIHSFSGFQAKYITQMLSVKPEMRPSASEVLEGDIFISKDQVRVSKLFSFRLFVLLFRPIFFLADNFGSHEVTGARTQRSDVTPLNGCQATRRDREFAAGACEVALDDASASRPHVVTSRVASCSGFHSKICCECV